MTKSGASSGFSRFQTCQYILLIDGPSQRVNKMQEDPNLGEAQVMGIGLTTSLS